jgi:hypothetical protein
VESQGLVTSGDLIIDKAKEIWKKVPEYRDTPVPDFSAGWLHRFKGRHTIRSRVQHGEAASVPVIAEDEMKALRTICGEYEEDAIYNMDETGLYWRNSITRGLATTPLPGRKADKSRITVALCTNATGTDRLPLLFIGNAKQPRALRGLNFEALGCQWRSSKKAWMNTIIMTEWLQFFYRHVGERSVILSMDNLQAHINATQAAPPPSNVHIIWFPKNSTSMFQPLDQGIIQTFKSHYRKQWLGFIIRSIDAQINPFKTITLNEVIHWCLHAWAHRVTNSTIYHCFRKSTIIETPINLPNAETSADLTTEYAALQTRFTDVMSLNHILNPDNENNQEDEPTTLDDIIDRHIEAEVTEEAILEDVEPAPVRLPSVGEAVAAVQLLQQFQERQEHTQHQDLQYLQRLERQLCMIEANSHTQSTLDRWLT